MDDQPRTRWWAAIRKKCRGEPVTVEEHSALIRAGSLKGLGKVEAEEQARYSLRYLLAGADLSDLPPRGWEEARDWLDMREVWGPELQAEKLRNMIEASDYDRDYWDALVYISMQFLAQRKPLPTRLANWNIEILLGLRSKTAAATKQQGATALRA